MTRWLALALLVGMIVAGCTAVDYHPPPIDPVAPGHDGSSGSGGGGGGM
jgi:hypothetical protein